MDRMKRIVRAAKYAARNRRASSFSYCRYKERALEERFKLEEGDGDEAMELSKRFKFEQQESIGELIARGITPCV